MSAPSNNKGKFITLEGGEGVGKSTQLRLLASHMRGLGLEVVETREPGGTPGAEAIRALLLDGEADRWNPRAEALLFAAARSDHVERVIRPGLESGAWVLCDRYIDSTRAYQAGASGLADEDIMAAHRIGSQGLMPDRTLLLSLPLDIAAERAAARDAARTFEEAGIDVVLREYAGMPHGFFGMHALVEASEQAIVFVAGRLRGALIG